MDSRRIDCHSLEKTALLACKSTNTTGRFQHVHSNYYYNVALNEQLAAGAAPRLFSASVLLLACFSQDYE